MKYFKKRTGDYLEGFGDCYNPIVEVIEKHSYRGKIQVTNSLVKDMVKVLEDIRTEWDSM